MIICDFTLSAGLIVWQQQYGRHTLPWQGTHDAYRIWLSEIMLQQTQVATVIPYYQRFLARFPDVFSLAEAPTSEVMALWSGLGYYSRARNLHQCAQRIVNDHHGIFPSDPVLLAKLPGIGRSTAAAIAVFSSGVRAAILDGNVKRVLTRVFGIEGYPASKPVEDALWQRAESLLPETEIESYTQGLMDLGATICTRTKPSCQTCPLSKRCVAHLSQRVNELPTRKPKKTIPEKQISMLVVIDRNQVLLEQRPNFGIWGGLWSLPEIDWSPSAKNNSAIDYITPAVMRYGKMASHKALAPFSHGFTHFKLHVFPFLVTLGARINIAAQDSHAWHDLDQLAQLGLPAPVRKLLEKWGSGE